MSAEELEVRIAQVEKEILNCDDEIRHTAHKADAENEAEERTYLRQKEEKLRKEKEQLRKEKEQLREEKKLLLIQQVQGSQVLSTRRCLPLLLDSISCLCSAHRASSHGSHGPSSCMLKVSSGEDWMWQLTLSLSGAMEFAGVRRRVYQILSSLGALYPEEAAQNSIHYEGKTLRVQVRHAVHCDVFLRVCC
jgi:hypothetical protein